MMQRERIIQAHTITVFRKAVSGASHTQHNWFWGCSCGQKLSAPYGCIEKFEARSDSWSHVGDLIRKARNERRPA